MQQLLQGKKTLITGGSAGIGKEIALCFANHGATVAIFGTNSERTEQMLQELETVRVLPEQKFRVMVIDVSDKSAVDQAIGVLLQEWGGVDVLVNNAGITRDGLLMKMSEEDWDVVLNVNLKSVYNTCSALARSMIKAKSGKIINISSVVGLMGNAGQANYAASKSGMIGMTKALAKELGSRNVHVNCIAPGFIQTRMTDSLDEEKKAGLMKGIPLGRLGVPRDIAQVALFLASPLADYITGQVIAVDGGMTLSS